MSTPTVQVVKERHFSKYNGDNKEISVQTWLKLFEVHTTKEASERVNILMYYLESAAIEWYGEEVANKSLSWDDTKKNLSKDLVSLPQHHSSTLKEEHSNVKKQ